MSLIIDQLHEWGQSSIWSWGHHGIGCQLWCVMGSVMVWNCPVIWNWIDSEWSEGEELPRQLKDLEWLYSVHFLSQVPQPASFMAVGEPEFICSHYTAACFTGDQSLSWFRRSPKVILKKWQLFPMLHHLRGNLLRGDIWTTTTFSWGIFQSMTFCWLLST